MKTTTKTKLKYQRILSFDEQEQEADCQKDIDNSIFIVSHNSIVMWMRMCNDKMKGSHSQIVSNFDG